MTFGLKRGRRGDKNLMYHVMKCIRDFILIFIPELSLALEYNGEYHYFPIPM